MFTIKSVISVLITILTGYVTIKIYSNKPSPVPILNENQYWGPGNPPKQEDISIRSFKINIDNKVLEDLKTRLETTRSITPSLEGMQQQYGFNSHLLEKVLDFWKTNYIWRDRELFLNKFPQFKTKIQGLDIHFLHVKPSVPSNVHVLPLLLLHGWPGSVREFYSIIPLLTQSLKGYNFVFEVIVPSLPGFGFSQAAAKSGLGAVQMAVIFKNLMKRLGHDKFYVHGGDFGGIIVTHMAVLFPRNILGLHSNFCFSSRLKSYFKLLIESVYSFLFRIKQNEYMAYPLSEKLSTFIEESGYFHIQATKPDTIGVALNQSPAGMAAYILEKFSTGTNISYKFQEDGGLLEKFTYTELLDNVMLYWVTSSMTTGFRIYAESFSKENRALDLFRIPISKEVPCACARFPYEIIYNTDWILKDKFTNLIQTTDFPRGGHFAAMEEPKMLAYDIFKAIAKIEKLIR